jgi:hypothetical protein
MYNPASFTFSLALVTDGSATKMPIKSLSFSIIAPSHYRPHQEAQTHTHSPIGSCTKLNLTHQLSHLHKIETDTLHPDRACWLFRNAPGIVPTAQILYKFHKQSRLESFQEGFTTNRTALNGKNTVGHHLESRGSKFNSLKY